MIRRASSSSTGGGALACALGHSFDVAKDVKKGEHSAKVEVHFVRGKTTYKMTFEVPIVVK